MCTTLICASSGSSTFSTPAARGNKSDRRRQAVRVDKMKVVVVEVAGVSARVLQMVWRFHHGNLYKGGRDSFLELLL